VLFGSDRAPPGFSFALIITVLVIANPSPDQPLASFFNLKKLCHEIMYKAYKSLCADRDAGIVTQNILPCS
jgi:hypothetical protein